VVRFLHDDPECSFDFLVDVTAVDRLKMKLRPRFEVVLHFYSSRSNQRYRVKVRPDNDSPRRSIRSVMFMPAPIGRNGKCGTCSACASQATRT